MILYHGSQQIIEKPEKTAGKKHNDYGQGFYCTENIELAKEWACPVKRSGYANRYVLNTEGLRIMHLTGNDADTPKNHILNWLAVLLQNRVFDVSAPIARQARDYIIENFSPNLQDADVIIGYRADDSYFSFAEDFISNTISLRDLTKAMHLGKLGEQVVLLSDRAFVHMQYQGYEIADYRTYYYKREARDKAARGDYRNMKQSLELLKDDLFILDMMREGMTNEDPRLR
ncbi:MAG: DUF3990 domain-containing protein [Firmicutes bacterium]|nr:DUF3990 domain-containing protein [Bacillota bacterium]